MWHATGSKRGVCNNNNNTRRVQFDCEAVLVTEANPHRSNALGLRASLSTQGQHARTKARPGSQMLHQQLTGVGHGHTQSKHVARFTRVQGCGRVYVKAHPYEDLRGQHAGTTGGTDLLLRLHCKDTP